MSKNKISDRSKREIENILQKLENFSFDETTIEKLMLEIRGLVPKSLDIQSVTEIAHFIAHVETRTKGFFNEEIDYIYSFLTIRNVFSNPSHPKFNTTRINKRLFEIFFLKSITKFNKKELKEKTGYTASEALNLVKSSYELEKDVFILKKEENIKDISIIFELTTASAKIFIDFPIERFLRELKSAILFLAKEINRTFDTKIFNTKRFKDEFVICVICLLHSRKFLLHDGNEAEFHLEVKRIIKDGKMCDKNLNFAVSCEVKTINVTFIVILYEISFEDFTRYTQLVVEKEETSPFIRMASFNANRNSNRDLLIQ